MDDLYRSRKNKWFAGVCGGLAERYGMDPTILRILTIVVTLFFSFIPAIVYIVAIFLLPLAPEEDETSADQQGDVKKAVPVRSGNGPNMADHIKILGILYIALSALGLFFAFLGFAIIAGGGLLSGDEEAILATSIISIVLAIVTLLLLAPGLIGGIGLLKRQSWSRVLVLVLGFINLLNFPLGTALGIYTIWVMNHQDTAALFAADEN